MIRKAFHRVQNSQQRLYTRHRRGRGGGGDCRGRLRLLRPPADGPAEGARRDALLRHEGAGRRHRQPRADRSQPRATCRARSRSERYLERRRQMENNYEQFLSGLNIYDRTLTPQEQLILRVTRLFGECEMAAPPEYLAEVSSYIRQLADDAAVRAGRWRRRRRWDTRAGSPRSSRRRTCRRSSSIWRCRRATSTRSPAARRPAWASPRACGSSSRRPASATG